MFRYFPIALTALKDAGFLMREKKGQQALLDSLLQSKQQLLAEELPKVCYSIGSLQCLDIIKAMPHSHASDICLMSNSTAIVKSDILRQC